MRLRTQHGFTLIELIVVISIIALMMSILLPALRQAREVARSHQCLSGLRQLGIGMTAHQVDNNGGMLPRYDDDTNLQWPVIVERYISGSTSANTVDMRDERTEGSIYYCSSWIPLDIVAEPLPVFVGYMGSFYPTSYITNSYPMIHYDPNGDVGSYSDILLPRHRSIDEIRHPSETMWLMDGAPAGLTPAIHNAVFFAVPGFTAPIHSNDSVNAMAVDGHAASLNHPTLLDAAAIAGSAGLDLIGWDSATANLLPE